MQNHINAVNEAVFFLDGNLNNFELIGSSDTSLAITNQSFGFSLDTGEACQGNIRVNNARIEVTFDAEADIPVLSVEHEKFQNLSFSNGDYMILQLMTISLSASKLATKINDRESYNVESQQVNPEGSYLHIENINGTNAHKATVTTTDPDLIEKIKELVQAHPV